MIKTHHYDPFYTQVGFIAQELSKTKIIRRREDQSIKAIHPDKDFAAIPIIVELW